jgi:outer membrane beta-barrel protein
VSAIVCHMIRTFLNRSAFLRSGFMVCAALWPIGLLGAEQQSEQFDKYEIRVIRPKFFTKTGRLETGAQMSIVMNQSFIYTYLATGILDYHFNEMFAAEGAAAYGISVDKDDKRTLSKDFGINTQILRTQYFMEGGLLYTPVYGKYQLSSGKVIYLDTFFSAGGGLTGIAYQYGHCDIKAGDDPAPADHTQSYPTFYLGGGQRIFVDKKTSLRWDVRAHIFPYDKKDGSCSPTTSASQPSTQTNITMQLGAGYFL